MTTLLEEEVSKQIGIGFSYPEILESLQKENYTAEEIEAAYTKMIKVTPTGYDGGGGGWSGKEIFSAIITIIIVIRLLWRLFG